MATNEKETKAQGNYTLSIPFKASDAKDVNQEQGVKVIAVTQAGKVYSKTTKPKNGSGIVEFSFKEKPGTLKIIIGPEDATDEELKGLQTVTLSLSSLQWGGKRELKLTPILIPQYYWYWWWFWCRTFTIRGRVLCPDGRPAAGAKVCAYDVDWWWFWWNKSQVGCATTDQNGYFEFSFRWCCHWWPWYWWRQRYWEINPVLIEHITPVLRANPEFGKLQLQSGNFDLGIFESILDESDAAELNLSSAQKSLITSGREDIFDPSILTSLREKLLKKLPYIEEFNRLRIWPWYPWYPWNDCTPDIIFKVTQDCKEKDTVIYEDSIFNTNWNIPTAYDVTLYANDKACCTIDDGGIEGTCAIITNVCDDPINIIGGNPGSLASPAGYVNPAVISNSGDRAYAGSVLIQGQVGNDVDYYEFEYSDNNGATWNTMPVSSVGNFSRQYWDMAPNPDVFPSVPFLHNVGGRLVYETVQHYMNVTNPGGWGASRFWMGANYISLMNWLTDPAFFRGTYLFRVIGWEESGGNLINKTVLPLCGTQDEERLVLTTDNRLVGSIVHPSTPSHPCGANTVHVCTDKPDTHILKVVVRKPDSSTVQVGPCGDVTVKQSYPNPSDYDVLEIDFLAHDPQGMLAYYSIVATYGINQVSNLLSLSPALSPSPVASPVPPASQVGPYYATARFSQGAAAPVWKGGTIHLEVKAKDAFPLTCCYQLELRAYDRTIVNCDHSYVYRNLTEFSLHVTVVP